MSNPTLIRPTVDADREIVTRIFDTANPAWATSAAEYRRGPKPASTNGIMLLAELDGRPVGAARASEALDGLLPRPGNFGARIAVVPDAEGRGIGGRLWNAIREWLDPQSPEEVSSWADHDDQRSVAIAGVWQFERRPGSIEGPDDLTGDQPWAWDYELRLDARITGDQPEVSSPPASITLSLLGEVLDAPALRSSLHEGHEECRSDVPAWETYERIGPNAFIRAQRDRLADGGTGIVAHRHGEVLAATFAERAAFVPMIHNDFTMVRRAARGQGLGLAVKAHLIREARAAGTERITTEVRTDNRPMLAINNALGFRRIAMRQLSRNNHAGRETHAPATVP